MPEQHIPVLAKEAISYLIHRKDGVYVDATLGDGGHAWEICRVLAPAGRLIGIDWDEEAVKRARMRLSPYGDKVLIIHDSYSRLETVLQEAGFPQVDGILLDLGVSTLQLTEPARGFTYRQDVPLDMRMDGRLEVSAADLVNELPEEELAGIIYKFGEERWAKRIARRIVTRRSKKPVMTGGELVDIIKEAIPAPARRQGGHPARRVFQALRLVVNNELNNIDSVLPQALCCLKPGGRLCVISYHSLEDRRIKRFFQKHSGRCSCPPELPCVCNKEGELEQLTPKAVKPGPEEVERNRRARSARLRAAALKSVLKDKAGE